MWGKAWSGKSTVSKILAEKLWYDYISIGSMKRKLAEEMWLTILEFNALWEEPGKSEEFDLKYEKFQEEIDLHSNTILESRLSFFKQPNAFKVFLDVDDYEAAKRIMADNRTTEKYDSIENFVAISQKRNEEDAKRFVKLYNVNYLDFKNYDLVVDTTNITPQEVVETILSEYEKFNKKV